MEKWVVTAKRADFNQIAHAFDIDPVVARVIRNRDVIGNDQIQKYLTGDKKLLYSPWLLKDMEHTVDLIEKKIKTHAPIRIIGDYDIDGIMATYILEQGLRALGADVDFMIPHRITDGYGLNEQLIRQAKEEKKDMIITCDNGISAFEQVALAKKMGLTVIVTDHHELLEGKIPQADCVINPKRTDCRYPFKGLCGAAVAYKVITALYEKRGILEQADDFLEYAAFATIGDVMDLVDENRIIVKEGLKRLHSTKNKGLYALMCVNGIEPESLSTYHIGFVLGPCLNASGRLDTAMHALELLRARDAVEAARKAGDLKNMNDSRKALTQIGVEQAIEYVESHDMKKDDIYVIYLPECHESLAGIIAGRIREMYHHPVFVLTRGEEEIKGSGRSIETYSMFEKMSHCRDLFTKFGGHKMAAGLSMKEDNIKILRKRLNEQSSLSADDFMEKVTIDVPMPISYVTDTIIQQLERLEPFGKGNNKPLFAQKGVQAVSYRIVGKNKNVITMSLDDGGGKLVQAICFQKTDHLEQILLSGRPFSIAYYPTLNVYNGKKNIQLVISHFQ